MKKISIYELMNVWKDFYNKINNVSNTALFSVEKTEPMFLDVYMSETEKIYGLSGKGTHIIRKLKDIALSQKEKFELFIPTNTTNKKEQNPLWNIKHGYMYYKNTSNIIKLNKIIQTVNYINTCYKGYELSEELISNKDKTNGIIGIDIYFDEPIWLSQIIKGNPMFNPIIDSDEKIIFGKGTTKATTIDKAIEFVIKKSDRFQTLFPKYINITSRDRNSLDEFIESKYIVSIIAYGRHARVIFKDTSLLKIIDSWKQEPDAMTKNLLKSYNHMEFIKRKPEQGKEGSCVAISFARALFTSDVGINTINDNIPYEYLILSKRLLSKFNL